MHLLLAAILLSCKTEEPEHVHQWGKWGVATAATETVNGSQARTCPDCGETETRVLYATGTAGLVIDILTNRVHNGGDRTFTAVHIPAARYDSDGNPWFIRGIGNDTNTGASNAFGGTNVSDTITYNDALTTVTFAAESQITSISGYAFSYCSNLTSITLPASVTSIGSNAFNSCTGLTSITLPASVTEINSQAFGFCTSLTSVTFEGTISSSGLYDFDTYAFGGMGDLRAKFYATDSDNGTPGTYTRSGSGATEDPYVWTKQ